MTKSQSSTEEPVLGSFHSVNEVEGGRPVLVTDFVLTLVIQPLNLTLDGTRIRCPLGAIIVILGVGIVIKRQSNSEDNLQ